jgi:hypothetical protein
MAENGILTKITNALNSVNQQGSQAPNGATATPVSFLAGRVKNIILDENSNGFNEFGEWNALGYIQYQDITNPTPQLSTAKPFYPNNKNFPLLEEIVWIVQLPSTAINGAAPDQPGVSTNINNYYINSTSLWNHPHHNGFPANPSSPLESQKRDYLQTSIGNVRRVTDQSTELNLGKTFVERSNIHPLKPFEGDIITEGRWGNSIRIGSTIKLKKPLDTPLNNWSEGTSTSGDPILIIRNGQGTQTNEGWIPVVEDINNDEASIYFTSTQKIPLKASSISYNSYKTPPTTPDQYAGKQIILNSGRLVFNTTQDHILFSSKKSVNLNAQESVNIDSKLNTIISSPLIKLGSKDATEPILKGDALVTELQSLITQLIQLTTVLVAVPQTSTAASLVLSELPKISARIALTKSKVNKII